MPHTETMGSAVAQNNAIAKVMHVDSVTAGGE